MTALEPEALELVREEDRRGHGHGDADEVVRTSWGEASKERLEELGCSVSFATYPGMAHSACPEEFDAISSFLSSI